MKLYKMTFNTKEYIKQYWHESAIEYTKDREEAYEFDQYKDAFVIECLVEEGFTKEGRQKVLL